MAIYYVGAIPFSSYGAIAHYRTKGSKNGVRKYQNADGSLTALGRVHYGIGQGVDAAKGAVTKAGASISRFASKAGSRAGEYITGNRARSNIAKAQGDLVKARGQNAPLTNTRIMAARGRQGTGHVAVSQERSRNSAASHASLRIAQNKRAYNKTLPGQVKATYANIKKNGPTAIKNAATNAAIGVGRGVEFLTGAGSRYFLNETKKKRRSANIIDKVLFDKDLKREQDFYQSAYDKSLPGRAEKLGNKVKSAVTQGYDRLKSWTKENVPKVKKAAKHVADTVSKVAKQTVSSIQKTASKGFEAAKNLFEGLFGKKKKK